jgi:hypothetical protein
VSKLLVGNKSARDSLTCASDGKPHVIVAVPNERIGSVFSRVGDLGGEATIAVGGPRKSLTLLAVRGIEGHCHEPDEPLLVHPNITVKMLIDSLWQYGGSGLLHISERSFDDDGDYELALADAPH